MYFWLAVLLQLGILLTAIYFYFNQKYTYWIKKGVNGPKPSFLKFGNLFQIMGAPPDIVEIEMFHKFGNKYGVYNGFDPVLTISDPELIKRVMVQDFHLFVNRRQLNTFHELFNNNLFFSQDNVWKRIRTITSPTFTSGKLRVMHSLMNRCVDKLVHYIDNIIETGNGVINTKEVIAGFTIDVIASTNFATETNANDNRSQTSPFVTNGLGLLDFPAFKLICVLGSPRWLNDLMGVYYGFREAHFNFFADLTRTIVRQRKSEQSGVKRNDLVQLLVDAYVFDSDLLETSYEKLATNIEAEETTTQSQISPSTNIKRTLTENEIISQCIFFFVAGFETTASTISAIIFELSWNSVVQERVFEEISQAINGLDINSDTYYETVMNKLPFMDAVIKEALRKYPPVVRLDRRCSTDGYNLGGTILDKGDLVEISTIATHYNPLFYPQPEKFNPERFMPENKHLLVPYAYLPFGQGPRNCVGMRFAYQEIRLCLAQILTLFKFAPTLETPKKLQFKPFKPLLNAEPFPIKVERR